MKDTDGEVRTNSIVTFSNGPFHTDVQVLADLQEHIDNSSVRPQDVVAKNCQKEWMIETNGESVREICASSTI